MTTILGDHEYCQKLGNFLKDFLNKEYVKERELNPLLPEATIVKTVKNYDSIVNNLGEFPLLKLYRTQDSFKKGTNFRISTITLTYSLTYPQQESIADSMYWISYKINEGLLHWDREVKGEFYQTNPNPPIISYLINASELLNKAYPVLRCSFQVRDSYMPCRGN